MRLRLRHSL
jgi:hypothetical protein